MNSFADLGFHASPLLRTSHCDIHGAFESRCLFRSVWSRCPECEAIRAENEAKEKVEKDRRERREMWERKVDTAGIPIRFRERSLANFDATNEGQHKALQFAKNYAANFTEGAFESGQSALFIGKPGTGKTHLAVSIGLMAMDRGHSVMFCTVMRAIRRVKDTWSRDSHESESQAVAALVFPDLLILDEVGVQFGSETEKNILFDVLNDRYEQRKPCLLLSNLPLKDVRSFLGERVFDRLREDGGEVVPFDWESNRAKIA